MSFSVLRCPLTQINGFFRPFVTARRPFIQGNTAQFPPCGLSTAPAAAARHLRCQNGDDRGYFMETYQIDDFAAAGIDKPFVQDNQSRSTKGVLRGLHFQKNHTQGKLVRVTMGEVYDVAVDCRPNSKTFGKWVGVTLSAENKKMFYIPEGFAHGFLVLSDVAEFCYKCTDVYDPTAEGGIPYDDPTVNVQWPDCGCEHKTSAKDKEHTPFAEQKFEYFEKY